MPLANRGGKGESPQSGTNPRNLTPSGRPRGSGPFAAPGRRNQHYGKILRGRPSTHRPDPTGIQRRNGQTTQRFLFICRRGNRDVAGIRRQRVNSWLKGTPFRQDKRQGTSQAPPVATLGIQPDRGE